MQSKNSFVLSMLLVFIFSLTHAQVYLGARISVNQNNFNGIHPQSKPRIASQIGVHSFLKLSGDDNWFLQPEFSYSKQGEYDQPIAPNGTQMKQRIFLHYLNVVTFVKYYLSPTKNGMYFEAGPYTSYRIKKRIDLYNFSTLTDQSTYKNFDVGGIAGVGFSLNKEWEFSLRYALGALDQIKNPTVKGKAFNSRINLGVSYSINTSQERLFRGRCKF